MNSAQKGAEALRLEEHCRAEKPSMLTLSL
jgi:hypothetical protein